MYDINCCLATITNKECSLRIMPVHAIGSGFTIGRPTAERNRSGLRNWLDCLATQYTSIKLLSLASLTRHLDSNQKGGGVNSGRSSAHKPGKLGLSCKATNRGDAAT